MNVKLLKYCFIGIIYFTITFNIKAQFVNNKYRNAFSNALRYYPEIDSNSIEIKNKKLCASMMARPQISYFFCKNRKYSIYINTSLKKTGFLPYYMPDSALAGLFGHELAHIYFYQNISRTNMIKFTFQYLRKSQIKRIERETDSITISKGLGNELFIFRNYIDTCSTINSKYKTKKEELYLNKTELLILIDEHNKISCDSLKN